MKERLKPHKRFIKVLVVLIVFLQFSIIKTFAQAETDKVPEKVLSINVQDQFLPANIVMDKTVYNAFKNSKNLDFHYKDSEIIKGYKMRPPCCGKWHTLILEEVYAEIYL